MNLLILSNYSVIALELNAKLRLHGFNSVLLTTKHVEGAKAVINVSVFKSKRILTLLNFARAFLYRKVLLRSKGLYFQDIAEDQGYYSIERIKKRTPFVPDVVLILFDYRMVTARTIADVHRWSKARVVWLMVDMKPMTGGCAYSGSCSKYRIGCGECPLIGNPCFRNYAAKTLAKRRQLLADVDLQVVAASADQYAQAQSSSLFGDRVVKKMFLPTDENVFRSNGQLAARNALRLPAEEERKIVLFGAQQFDSERKGYRFLIEALYALKRSAPHLDVILLVVGNGVLPTDIEQLYRVVRLGWVDFPKLSLAYQAADIFVSPSIEDSGPTMVNQSMMCGTPVVSFKTGVSVDLVTDGKTGFLAELRDSAALARGIKQILILSPEERDRVNAECLKVAEALNYRAFVGNLSALLA